MFTNGRSISDLNAVLNMRFSMKTKHKKLNYSRFQIVQSSKNVNLKHVFERKLFNPFPQPLKLKVSTHFV